MINTARTEIEGRTYEIVADSDHINDPMFLYCQVYRLRKDGSRGRALAMHHKAAWKAWASVRDQIKEAEAKPANGSPGPKLLTDTILGKI